MTTTIPITGDSSQDWLAADVVEQLRAQVRGPVVTAGDPEAEQEPRPVWNAMHVARPSLAVRCAGTADVADAVNFAREHDLLVAVRGGGHSVAGLSTVGDGVLIDLSAMRGVRVDPQRRLVHVGGGALLGDIDRETQAFGLATPTGRVSETGIAGLALVGGYGHLNNKYGLTCDNLVEAEVVCADGEIRTASAETNPDLFWALRGGGGNFGVVTSFTFRLHPVGPMMGFAAVFYPLEELAEIERRWRDWVVTAPDEITSGILTLTFPAVPDMPEVMHDRQVALVSGMYSGDPDQGMRELQPLREFGTPVFDMSQPMPYAVIQSNFDAFFPRGGLRSYWKSQYVDELTDDAIDTIAEIALDRPAPLTLVNTFHFGGAVHALGAEETAFAERSAPFLASVDTMWSNPAHDAACVAWGRAASQKLSAHGNGSVFLNFTGLADEPAESGVGTAYGRNLRRLRQVKASYDPTNLFRLNNNITPEP